MRSSFLILFLTLLLAGCAGEKLVMRLNPAPTEASQRMFFPPPSDGEVPRYFFAGQLVGEPNFVEPEGQGKNALVTALKWIVGLFEVQNPIVLQRPQSGVVDGEGRILITDVSRSAIYVFDEKAGRLDLWEFAAGNRRFITPAGIALGPDGRVFVADAELQEIVSLDRDGNGVSLIGPGQLMRPTGLAWDGSASLLYVSDTQAHQIKVFDKTGRLVRTIGKRGEGPGEFNFPTHIALHGGSLVVSDSMNARVQVLSLADDRPPLIIGKRGRQIGNLVRPKGVAVDSEGNIYVVESYHDHLLVFDRNGRFLLPIGGTGQEVGSFYLPGGVWTDSRNRVFVADTFNGRTVIFQFLGGGVESE